MWCVNPSRLARETRSRDDAPRASIQAGKRQITTATHYVGNHPAATHADLFSAFPTVANLADKSDGRNITIRVTSTSAGCYEPVWLRNSVDKPLGEADIDRQVRR